MPARCPGQDQRNWKPEDIFDVGCPYCARQIEFWKDEPVRVCPGCGREVRNPRMNVACAAWCSSAADCLGHPVDGDRIPAPVVERLVVLLEQRLWDDPGALERARLTCAALDDLLGSRKADPRLAKPAALLAGAVAGRTAGTSIPALQVEAMVELLVRSDLGDGEARAIAAIVHSAIAGAAVQDAESCLVREALELTTRR